MCRMVETGDSGCFRRMETVRMRARSGLLPPAKIFRFVILGAISILGCVLLLSSGGTWMSRDGSQLFSHIPQVDDEPIGRARGSPDALQGEHPFLVAPPQPQYSGGKIVSQDTPDQSEEKGRYPIGQGVFGATDYPVKSFLIEGVVQPDVHYLWCGHRWFEFKHYLGVMSVLRSIRPDKVYIHYEHPFEIDEVHYNQWMDDLKYDYPWLHVVQMDDELTKYCAVQDYNEKVQIILRLLNEDGGMFVGEKTWMLNFPTTRRLVDFDFGLQRQAMEGYIVMRKGILADDSTSYKQLLQNSDRSKYRRSTCARVHHIYRKGDLYNMSSCLVLSGQLYERFFPMDIWELDDPFGRLARRIFHGTEQIRRPVPTFKDLVPNIGHMIWIGGGRMDYVFYLSLLSLLYVAKMDVVYVHGDAEPAGEYWQEIKTMEQTKNRVKFIYRTPPVQIYQDKIEPFYRALMSDLIRVDLMIKYGGVYTDTDAIWVKPLSDVDRGYDAVASFDWVDWSWPFPDSVNFGISYGKKNAPFWRIFRESMRTLHNDIHGFSGVMMPYKLLEKYPHLLRIDRRLQVICYHSKCHPIWVHDYHNMTKDHTNMNSIPDWRQDVNAFHWTHPNPTEYANRTTLLNSSGMFAEIGQNVLRMAGLL